MLCPRCQRPLEDTSEGAYICCAGATLRWRCTGCSKVSEGFAFPYRRCPSCAGTLQLLEDAAALAPTSGAAALAGVRTAFEIELGGRAFYQRAAAEAGNAEMAQLFGRFALMEGEHMETLSQRYHIDVPPPSPEFRREVAALYANVSDRPQEPDNLFRIAIGLEQRAAGYFAEHAARLPAGSAEQRLYQELAAEEREHAELLTTEWERWRNGRPALMSPAAPLEPVSGQGCNAALQLVDRDPARIALECAGQRLSYGELRERTARAAGLWRSRGLRRGDRVAVKLPDGIDWVVAFLGAMWAGLVAVPVNPRIPTPEWHYILDEAGFSVILIADDADSLQRELADTPSPWRERLLPLADFRRELAAAEPAPVADLHPDTPAYWCHSSGTSGKPKAVVHAHRFADAVEQVSREGLGFTADDRLFASSKLFFAYPKTNSLWAGLKLGATVLLDPQWPTAAGVVASVEALRPTVLLSVPSLYRNLVNEGLAARIAAAGVRKCVSAGEALPPSLREAWRRDTGLAIANGYGASETLVLVMLDHGDGRDFQPAPGVTIEPLEPVADGLPIRLLIGAPTLALGYLDRPQAQAEHFRNGRFCPADLFARTAQGGWRFAGREDSLVKIHGRWVNLVDLEERLASQAGVTEAAAVLVPDADGVDAVAFFYCARDEAAAAVAADSLRRTADALPPHQRPHWWHELDALPRGPTGKLLRRRLQELHRTLEDPSA